MSFTKYCEFVDLYDLWKTEGNKAILKALETGVFEQFTLDALLSVALRNYPFKKLVRRLMNLGADLFADLSEARFLYTKHPISNFRTDLRTAKILFAYPKFTKRIVNYYKHYFGKKISKHYKFLESQGITTDDFEAENWSQELFAHLGSPSVEKCVQSILYSRSNDWLIKFIPEDHPEHPKCIFIVTSHRNNYQPSTRVSQCVKNRTFDSSIVESLKKELEIFPYYDMALCETILTNEDFEAIDFLIELGLARKFSLVHYRLTDKVLLYLSQNIGPTDFDFSYWRMDYVSIKDFDKILELFSEQLDLLKLEKELPSMNVGLDTYLGMRKSLKRVIEENMAQC
jgi:hypothetical protein